MSEKYTPERLADRAEIQDAILLWCRSIDRLDIEGIRRVFHPDAVDNHGVSVFDVDGLINWIETRHRKISVSLHRVSNIFIEFAGPDLALVESYADVVQCYPPGGQASLSQISGHREHREDVGHLLLAPGRYVDQFERRDGTWKIARRTVIFEAAQVFEMPQAMPKAGPKAVEGRRSDEDFIFEQSRLLGLGV